MDEFATRQHLRVCADAASVAWRELIQSAGWKALDDSLRQRLVRAVAWANKISETGAFVDARVAKSLIDDLRQLAWPDGAAPIGELMRQCAELAVRLGELQAPPKISEFDLHRISDGARILLTVRAAERALALLPEGLTPAHRSALQAALDWAKSIGEGRVPLQEGAERPFLAAIAALQWPAHSAAIVRSVSSCLNTASNPWIWEMSQARFEHLVASVDLHAALQAGVSEADIGRDYLQLRLAR